MMTSIQNASMKARVSMEDDMKKLEDQLQQYLSFHNVRGWTIF